MIDNSEIIRRLNNLINIGKVIKIDETRMLAKVDIAGRESDFLPFLAFANSFKKHSFPVRVGEQVLVLSPFGDGDFGVIVGSIFNKHCKEPNYNNNKEVIEYEDGTTISYDTKRKKLKIDAVNKIDILCKDANIKANSVKVDSPSIDMGLGGKGVVTGECVCAFTGLPHHDFSSNTRSKK